MNTEEMPWDTQGYSRSTMPQLQGNIESAPDILKMKKKISGQQIPAARML